MIPAQSDQGSVTGFDTVLDPAAVRFTIDSLRETERIKTLIASALRMHSASRAIRDGRLSVTDEDVSASLGDALADVARQWAVNENG